MSVSQSALALDLHAKYSTGGAVLFDGGSETESLTPMSRSIVCSTALGDETGSMTRVDLGS
jgi:hypothetical protein